MRPAGSSKLLRAMNESAALGYLLEPGRLTRADLRRLTALSTPTISEVLRRLTGAGLVGVVGHNSGRPGPNAEIYAVNPDVAYAAAISVRDTGPPGAATVDAALCDLTGTVRTRLTARIELRCTDLVTAIGGVVARLSAAAGIGTDKIRYVQLGVAGTYDPRTETIRHADLPGLGRAGLVPKIATALGTPVGADNDVNLAAVAERQRGAGRDTDGFALLWLGSDGVGLAIDIDGALIRGARGGAGEIGYLPLYAPGPAGRQRDLQHLLGGTAILDLARDNGVPGTTPADAVRKAADDPTAAGDFLTVLADRIAVGLAATIAVLDPYLVVLAGPIAQAGGETLLAAVTTAVRRVAPLESSLTVTTIDDDAVLLGALDAALNKVRAALIASIRELV